MQRWHFFNLLLLTLYLSSCQDPSTFGVDLLDEDQAKVDFTDTFSVQAATVVGDSVVTFLPGSINQLSSYLFGDLRDPLFGRSVASVYTQLRLERIKPDFTGTTLDSVVLVLPYDTTGLYGQIQGETFGIEIFRVIEPMSPSEAYYSSRNFQVEAAPLASMEFTPSLDSIPVVDYLSASVQDTIFFPHLRVPLSQALGQELLGLDTTTTASSTDFIEFFQGIHIRPTLPTGGLLSFDLNSSPFRGGIYLYYSDDEGVRRQFHFEIDEFTVRTANYEHDYAGAPIGEVLDDTAAGDTVLYVQGLAGLRARIQLPDLSDFEETVIVNKAELIVELKMPQTDERFPPAGQLLLSTIENGEERSISDISLANNPQSVGLDRGFGGLLNEETGQYVMNISTHFQEVLKGIRPNTLYLSAFPNNESAARAILNGAKDGIKIRLSFTKL